MSADTLWSVTLTAADGREYTRTMLARNMSLPGTVPSSRETVPSEVLGWVENVWAPSYGPGARIVYSIERPMVLRPGTPDSYPASSSSSFVVHDSWDAQHWDPYDSEGNA